MSSKLTRCKAEYGDPRLDSVDDSINEHPDDCEGCDLCGGNLPHQRPVLYVVATYLVERCWGGPEEGGWWYDAGELVRQHRVYRSFESAATFARRMNRHIDATLNYGRRPLDSVLSDGRYRASVEESETGAAPPHVPMVRPRYE